MVPNRATHHILRPVVWFLCHYARLSVFLSHVWKLYKFSFILGGVDNESSIL